MSLILNLHADFILLCIVKTISTGFGHGTLKDLLAVIEMDPGRAHSLRQCGRKGLQEHDEV